MKVDFKSLKFKNRFYLIAYSFFILSFLWILQILFFTGYYKMMRTNEVKKMGESLVENYKEDTFVSDMNQFAFNNNISVNLVKKDGEILYSMDALNPFRDDFDRRRMRIPKDQFNDIQKTLFVEEKKEHVGIFGERDRSIIVFAASLKTKAFGDGILLLLSPLSPVESAISVLKNQLIIITMVVLVISIVLSERISKKITTPIIRLTQSAKKLADGDMNVVFEESPFSEIQQLSQTLNYATKEISKTDQYRKEFIANVSHDLKTPLTIIQFYSEMLLEGVGDTPEKRKKFSEVILSETSRLTTLVEEILELSKLQAGNEILCKEEVNLSALLITVMEKFQVLEEKEQYVFEAQVAPDVFVWVDEMRIKRAIYNLMSNAVNYTGVDKKVTVKLFVNDQRARVEIIDTGEGIAPEEQAKIWERYYKSNTNHVRSVVGTGLGLPIVKSIFEAHGIRFDVESQPNQGSIFWFEISCVKKD